MTWLEKLIDAFEQIPEEEVKYAKLYNYFVEKYGNELPVSYKNIIQRRIQDNSRDSQRNSPNNDKKPHIFSAPKGLGKGIWKLNSKISSATIIAPDLGIVKEEETARRVGQQIFRVLRDTKLSRTLKILHDHKCQVCRKSVSFGKFLYSEAHHIQPLGNPHNGPDSFDNILILCPNHHVEFDYGLMAIDREFKITHQDATNPYIGCFLNISDNHKINQKYLDYHYNILFHKIISE